MRPTSACVLAQAVWGCLKDALSELHEGQEWGLLGADFAAAQHRRLYNLAAQELLNAKALVLGLAHEHGVTAAYSAALRRPLQHTVADYERVGELRFALLVWRANLQRDLSVASGPADAEARVKEGYIAAVDLVHRCVDNSAEFWAAQQAGGAPGEAERRAVRAAALAKAQRSLLDIAEQHHVSKAAVQALL
jgi:hypothetical protein